MKITDPGEETVKAATDGDFDALNRLLVAIQPGVFNLAVRMLGQRDDAADAAQEILLKVVTHLGSFRGEASFTTWVYQVARNHLLTAVTRSRESPEVSLDAIADRLQAGLDFVTLQGLEHGDAQIIGPQDKAEARQVALGCTQNMLMALDREQRLVYLLDTVFALPSRQAAEVLGITPPAYRQRLSRTRARLDGFVGATCGLVNADAACRCERQLPALRHERAANGVSRTTVVAVDRRRAVEAEIHFDAFTRLSDAAAVFRAHPEHHAPEGLLGAIRTVLGAEGYWGDAPVH